MLTRKPACWTKFDVRYDALSSLQSCELRNDIEKLRNVLVPILKQKDTQTKGMGGKAEMTGGNVAHVPLGLLGKIEATMGPPIIKDEMGSLNGWVYVDLE